MSNSQKEYRRYLAVEDQLRALVREGKRDSLVVRQALQAIINAIAISATDCRRFLLEFVGLAEDRVGFLHGRPPADKPYWPDPDWGPTYAELADLVERRDVPRYDWTCNQLRQIDGTFDIRQPDPAGRLLYTPAEIEATHACPEFVGVSYRKLWWQHKEAVVTAREAVILWLLVYWKSGGKTQLDRKGWTRTGSQGVNGDGVYVNGGGGRLGVNGSNPDSSTPLGSSRSVVLG